MVVTTVGIPVISAISCGSWAIIWFCKQSIFLLSSSICFTCEMASSWSWILHRCKGIGFCCKEYGMHEQSFSGSMHIENGFIQCRSPFTWLWIPLDNIFFAAPLQWFALLQRWCQFSSRQTYIPSWLTLRSKTIGLSWIWMRLKPILKLFGTKSCHPILSINELKSTLISRAKFCCEHCSSMLMWRHKTVPSGAVERLSITSRCQKYDHKNTSRLLGAIFRTYQWTLQCDRIW